MERTMAIDALYSVQGALKRAEIVPRSEPYQLEDIRDALGEELSNGFHVQLHCLTDKKTRQTLLGDVRMCIDKSFQPIDCPRSGAFQPPVYISGHSPPLPSFKFCDGSPRKFDSKLIESIEQTLLKMWPNLYPAKTAHSFWKHEWEKHGTCAQNHHNLSSELLYFNTTMAIDALYSVQGALKRAEIVPRSEPYQLEDIRDALGEELSNGFHVQLHCLTDKKTRQTLLGDVRMCIDKSFQPIDCPRSGAFQPPVYISGHSPPLPSFKECPSSVIYLLETTTKPLNILGMEHQELTYWINPLIPIYSRFFSHQNIKQEFLLGLTIPFMAIAIFIYIEARRRG
ncbi:ribonuclease, T2 family [Ostertagia ostertagi]